jgi:DNA-binding XRE family transcriptional regulator
MQRDAKKEVRNMPFEKIDIEKILNDELKDPEFKFYYEKISREYDLIEQLVAIRKKKKITQTQLSKIANVSQQAISRLENEKHIPKIDTLLKIVHGLGAELTVTEIFK